jgi:hypothetical protein
VFDAEDVPHAAQAPMARAMVVSIATTRAAAVVGIGTAAAYAVSDVPSMTEPWPVIDPVVPIAVTMPSQCSCHGQAAAPEPVVMAAVWAMTVVMAAA